MEETGTKTIDNPQGNGNDLNLSKEVTLIQKKYHIIGRKKKSI